MNIDILNSKEAYKAPRTKVVEINEQSVLCQSSGSDADTGSVTINGYTEDELDW